MKTETKVYSFPNGEIQRVQLVRPADWSELEFLHPVWSSDVTEEFVKIYRHYLVPACPWIFGNLVLFCLPDGLETAFPLSTKRHGEVAEPLTAAAAALRHGVKLIDGKPVFRNPQIRAFWNQLEAQGCVSVVRGKLPVTTIIPVGREAGFLTQTEPDAAMKINANFFIMDRFDCASVYDHVGIPFGMCVKDGTVLQPPLFGREALLVRRDGRVSVETPDLRTMEIEIGGRCFRHGDHAEIFTRPERAHTPFGKRQNLVIIGRRVEAVHMGRTEIPASGFVLCPDQPCEIRPGDLVTYRGMEDVLFGMQVGNSIVRDGEKTTEFRSRFYNLRGMEPVPFPPSLYPLDYNGARAARIALGADEEGKPMLLWAEGAAKMGYVPGESSRGATLQDMAEICAELGMKQAVNLDGGGSAQILLNNRRSLQISGRDPVDFSESERAVPLGLIVRT